MGNAAFAQRRQTSIDLMRRHDARARAAARFEGCSDDGQSAATPSGKSFLHERHLLRESVGVASRHARSTRFAIRRARAAVLRGESGPPVTRMCYPERQLAIRTAESRHAAARRMSCTVWLSALSPPRAVRMQPMGFASLWSAPIFFGVVSATVNRMTAARVRRAVARCSCSTDCGLRVRPRAPRRRTNADSRSHL